MKNSQIIGILFSLFFIAEFNIGLAQCTASVSSDTDFSDITWTGTDAATCNSWSPGDNVNFDNDLTINYANSNDVVTMDLNLTTDDPGGIADFNMSGTGSGNGFEVPDGFVVDIEGNVGDPANNNIQYIIDGTMNWGGTFSGKNSNAFSGDGAANGGDLDFSSEPSCTGAICSSFNVTDCEPANTVFCNTALPIVLGSFEAIPTDDLVALEWETLSEENFDYFSIERSENGLTFEEIATVPGNGNSNERIQYSFEDENPLFGTSFYRLNAIDYDGSYEKFQILSVEYLPEDLQVLVYPNPASTQNIRLSLGLPKDANLKKVSVYDLSGNHILDQNLKIGNNDLKLTSKLQSGIYLAKVQIDNYRITRRLVID
ncbi:MAG: T9SS type A sorting domain-containing protein [Cyclobacteriaceae bacterium]